jgi:hypothetical protein
MPEHMMHIKYERVNERGVFANREIEHKSRELGVLLIVKPGFHEPRRYELIHDISNHEHPSSNIKQTMKKRKLMKKVLPPS